MSLPATGSGSFPRRHVLRTTAALFLALASGIGPASAELSQFLDGAYPIEASVCFSAGLFHWVDSLAGTSGGKTVGVHRKEYEDRFGALTEEDTQHLARFRGIRIRDARVTRTGGDVRGSEALLAVFLEEPSLDAALDRLRGHLPSSDLDAMGATLRYFRPRFAKIWRQGEIPRLFLERVKNDPARDALSSFLVKVARFFSVDPTSEPRPRLTLVAVPRGGGTHAETAGRHLLVEIREGESLVDEVAPIVHENAHFLWDRMSTDRLEGLAAAIRVHPKGAVAGGVLREALPTAIAQGAAARAFLGPRWSLDAIWYHTDEVDSHAKAIYPAVQEALDAGAVLDETLLAKLLDLLPSWIAPKGAPNPTATPR